MKIEMPKSLVLCEEEIPALEGEDVGVDLSCIYSANASYVLLINILVKKRHQRFKYFF